MPNMHGCFPACLCHKLRPLVLRLLPAGASIAGAQMRCLQRPNHVRPPCLCYSHASRRVSCQQSVGKPRHCCLCSFSCCRRIRYYCKVTPTHLHPQLTSEERRDLDARLAAIGGQSSVFAGFAGLAARWRQQAAGLEGSKIATLIAIAVVLALMSSDTGQSG